VEQDLSLKLIIFYYLIFNISIVFTKYENPTIWDGELKSVCPFLARLQGVNLFYLMVLKILSLKLYFLQFGKYILYHRA